MIKRARFDKHTGRVQRTVALYDPEVVVVHVRVMSSPGVAVRMDGVVEWITCVPAHSQILSSLYSLRYP